MALLYTIKPYILFKAAELSVREIPNFMWVACEYQDYIVTRADSRLHIVNSFVWLF